MSINLIRSELIAFNEFVANEGNDIAIFLNANESPWEDSISIQNKGVNRYPKKMEPLLLEQLAQYYQVPVSWVLMTRGSDEGIDLLIRLFCQAYQDDVIVCPPTFTMYQQSAYLQGAKVIEVPLKEEEGFSLNLSEMSKNLGKNVKLIFLCSPNNPTGTLIEREDILDLCRQWKNKAIVVVDEAYLEFSEAASLISAVQQYDNLVILRTLSKAFGMADLRCGIIIAQPSIIKYLDKIMPPYPFSSFVFQAAVCATQRKHIDAMRKKILEIKAQRKKMIDELRTLPWIDKLWPSEANFILVRCSNAKTVFEFLIQHGILVRAFKEKSLASCLRISIGLEKENQRLLSLLKKIESNNE